jgi:radical SAM superfamily enzyme YgiQ (UPF0313 family)
VKVLVVSANREPAPYPVAPLGALCVTAAARAAGHEVDLLDLGARAFPARALRRALALGRYQAIGLSIRNLDNCSFARPVSYFEPVRALTQIVRRLSGAPLILGGSGLSVAPRGWMARLAADYAIVGEGEFAFVELLRRIESGQSAQNLGGVVRAEDVGRDPGAQPPCIPATMPRDLDALPPPDHARCDYARYLARGGYVSVQTKRGCPFACIYCVYPGLEGAACRLRAPKRVADEMQSVLRDQQARHFFITDSVFNSPRAHALAVCEALIRRRLAARWMAYCNPLGFDGELARTMARAGCAGVEFGLDAATDKMLARLRKPFGPEDIERSFEAAAAAGLPFAVHLLFGGPGETARDWDETQQFLDRCAPANAVFASLGLRIYEGTELARIARAEGRLAAGADLFEPAFYLSEELGGESLLTLDGVARRREEWSSPADWQKFSLRAIQKLMNRLGVRPQWRNVRNYGRRLRR